MEPEGSLPWDPILSQPNPVRPIDLYLSKVQLNVILPPTPRSSQWSLTFWPTNLNPVNTSPLPRACQRISPVPRRFETFRNNKKFLRWGVVSPCPTVQAVGPPLVGCPWLLILYIRSYPPYPEDFLPSATWGRAMPWWQGTHLTWICRF
jgi:hypothetical protein